MKKKGNSRSSNKRLQRPTRQTKNVTTKRLLKYICISSIKPFHLISFLLCLYRYFVDCFFWLCFATPFLFFFCYILQCLLFARSLLSLNEMVLFFQFSINYIFLLSWLYFHRICFSVKLQLVTFCQWIFLFLSLLSVKTLNILWSI